MWGQTGGLLFGFLGTWFFGLDQFEQVQQAELCLGLFAVLSFIAAICTLFIDEKLLRLMHAKPESR